MTKKALVAVLMLAATLTALRAPLLGPRPQGGVRGAGPGRGRRAAAARARSGATAQSLRLSNQAFAALSSETRR